MRSNEPDVFGASVRQIFPMYPTLRPSTATMSANAMSESTMTGRVRLSGEALHSMKKGIRPEILSKLTVTCFSYALHSMQPYPFEKFPSRIQRNKKI